MATYQNDRDYAITRNLRFKRDLSEHSCEQTIYTHLLSFDRDPSNPSAEPRPTVEGRTKALEWVRGVWKTANVAMNSAYELEIDDNPRRRLLAMEQEKLRVLDRIKWNYRGSFHTKSHADAYPELSFTVGTREIGDRIWYMASYGIMREVKNTAFGSYSYFLTMDEVLEFLRNEMELVGRPNLYLHYQQELIAREEQQMGGPLSRDHRKDFLRENRRKISEIVNSILSDVKVDNTLLTISRSSDIRTIPDLTKRFLIPFAEERLENIKQHEREQEQARRLVDSNPVDLDSHRLPVGDADIDSDRLVPPDRFVSQTNHEYSAVPSSTRTHRNGFIASASEVSVNETQDGDAVVTEPRHGTVLTPGRGVNPTVKPGKDNRPSAISHILGETPAEHQDQSGETEESSRDLPTRISPVITTSSSAKSPEEMTDETSAVNNDYVESNDSSTDDKTVPVSDIEVPPLVAPPVTHPENGSKNRAPAPKNKNSDDAVKTLGIIAAGVGAGAATGSVLPHVTSMNGDTSVNHENNADATITTDDENVKNTKNESVDDKSVDDESMDDKSVDDESMDNKSVDDKSMDNKSVDDKSMDNKSVDDKSMDNKSVDDESVDDKSVDDESVDDKSVDDKSVDDKNGDSDETENVEAERALVTVPTNPSDEDLDKFSTEVLSKTNDRTLDVETKSDDTNTSMTVDNGDNSDSVSTEDVVGDTDLDEDEESLDKFIDVDDDASEQVGESKESDDVTIPDSNDEDHEEEIPSQVNDESLEEFMSDSEVADRLRESAPEIFNIHRFPVIQNDNRMNIDDDLDDFLDNN